MISGSKHQAERLCKIGLVPLNIQWNGRAELVVMLESITGVKRVEQGKL